MSPKHGGLESFSQPFFFLTTKHSTVITFAGQTPTSCTRFIIRTCPVPICRVSIKCYRGCKGTSPRGRLAFYSVLYRTKRQHLVESVPVNNFNRSRGKNIYVSRYLELVRGTEYRLQYNSPPTGTE